MEHSARILTLASRVKLAIFDVDGVLTDGRLMLGPKGQEFQEGLIRLHMNEALGKPSLPDKIAHIFKIPCVVLVFIGH